MKLLVKGQPESENEPVYLYLEKEREGDVNLVAEKDGQRTTLAWFEQDGSFYLLGGIPSNLGFQLDDNGKLKPDA